MGERIRQKRKALGLTQSELGKMVGVTKGAVALWESGDTKNLKLVNVLSVCTHLQTDLAELIYGRPADVWSAQTPAEREIIQIFRATTSNEVRQQIIGAAKYIRSITPTSPKKFVPLKAQPERVR